jgi:RHS repeat-associated protein
VIRAAFVALIAALLPFSALAQVNWSGGVVYEYDGSGNVRKIGTDTYVYDTAQRLIRGSAAGSQQSYTYDSFGNRKACQGDGGGDCQYGFQVDSATNRVKGRAYDKRGNLLQLPEGNTLEYDELGMVRKENGTSRQVYYIYTADDERIAVYEADTQFAKHTWQWTVRDLDKKPLREFASDGASGTGNFKWSKDHVWRDGVLLASRQPDANASSGVSTYHYHVDHLGTPRQVTNSASVIIGGHDYLPFGPEVTRTTINEPALQDLKFTGHERDEARDRPPIDYMHARYYEPRLGRFLSVDPTWESADLGTPQSWNRYSYVRNNPVNMTDPDGKVPIVPIVMGLLWLGDKAYAAYEARQDYKAVKSGQTTVTDVAQRRAIETTLGMAAGPLGRLGGKAVTKIIIKNADEATSLTSRAARREATRQAGIPTSQQPTSQSSPHGPGNLPAGRQLEYDTPEGRKVVQHQLQDQNHGPHWEAGKPKPGGQTDPAGRPRLQNDKVKVDEKDPQ